MAPATIPLHHHGSGSDGTTPRALDPAEKQPQDFTHSAVVQQLLFGSDATEGEDGPFDKIINYTRNVIIRTHEDYFSQTKAASGLRPRSNSSSPSLV